MYAALSRIRFCRNNHCGTCCNGPMTELKPSMKSELENLPSASMLKVSLAVLLVSLSLGTLVFVTLVQSRELALLKSRIELLEKVAGKEMSAGERTRSRRSVDPRCANASSRPSLSADEELRTMIADLVHSSIQNHYLRTEERLKTLTLYGSRSPSPSLIRGPQGPLGPPGPPGENGRNGLPGQMGPAGPPGPMGPVSRDGIPGKDGRPGHNGLPGYHGHTGPKGEKGETGEPGEPGYPGYPGLQGPEGRSGRAGRNGEKGMKGEKGDCSTLNSKGLEMDEASEYEVLLSKSSPDSVPRPARRESTAYIRWGLSHCPHQEASLLYSGQLAIAKGKTSSLDAPSDAFCLPLSQYNSFSVQRPRFSRRSHSNVSTEEGSGTFGHLAVPPVDYRTANTSRTTASPSHEGVETKGPSGIPSDSQNYLYTFGAVKTSQNYVPCSFCHLSGRSLVLVLLDRSECPRNWFLEYHGFYAAAHLGLQRSTMLCIDHRGVGFSPSSSDVARSIVGAQVQMVRVQDRVEGPRTVVCVVCSL